MNNGRVASFCDNSAHGEDALVVRELSETSCLDAVLDGVTQCQGGYASDFTSQMLRDSPIASLEELLAALEQSNLTLFHGGGGRDLLTTASAALKLGTTVHSVNVGDSPVYLVRGGGILELSTIVQAGPLSNLPNGAVGRRETLSYKHRAVELEPGDRLVLATDGLLHNLTPEEVAAVVARSSTAEEAVAALQAVVDEKRAAHQGRPDTYGTFREDDRTAVVRYLD
ncbi:MAG: SpoIIE family protein phosphatase [Dehalococcoidia bacterium]|nr:SpoIIE family protein phosphatase [Dehalococcoidia bacterium]